MIRIICLLGVFLTLVQCSEKKSDDVDVTEEFLSKMAGSYSAAPNQKALLGLANDTFTVEPDGDFTMSQYWHLEYPSESCVIQNGEALCTIKLRTTYCRILDSGVIRKVLENFVDEAQPNKTHKETHRIQGILTNSVYDSENPFTTDPPASESLMASHEAACADLASQRYQKRGTKLSVFSIFWSTPNALRFNHKTGPESAEIEGLDEETSGLFVKAE